MFACAFFLIKVHVLGHKVSNRKFAPGTSGDSGEWLQ